MKWPKYVRIQRQRRVLNQRLKVPPALNRFTKAVDRNLAETIFKLLLKYRPETRNAKKNRLLNEADARSAGIKYDKKKPVRYPYVALAISQGLLQNTPSGTWVQLAPHDLCVVHPRGFCLCTPHDFVYCPLSF